MAKGRDFFEVVKKKWAVDPKFGRLIDEKYAKFKFGLELRRYREEAKLSQKDIAEKIGMKQSNVSRLENHAESMNTATLVAYLNACGRRLYIR
jgi:predicted XRE-type DNA-binding protein